MAIIYRIIDNNKKKNPKPIQASSNKIDRKEQKKKGKEIDYFLHERALLCERIFQDSKKFIQFSLKPKIFYLQ